MPEPIFVHASQGPPAHPHPAAPRRARGYPVRQKAPENRRVRWSLLPAGRHRRDGFARSKSLRVAPSSLPGPEEDPPSGAGHRDGDKRRTDRQLAERHPCSCYAALSVDRTGSGELIVPLRRINQQYLTRTLPGVASIYPEFIRNSSGIHRRML